MLALIFYFVGSHIISFVCSIFEAVLLSCTPTYIALLKKKGLPAAKPLEKLKSEIDRPLAAILTLNTISHTFGAAGVGASVVELFGDKWLALGSVVLTLTMLYWTEMLPKTLGAVYWKKLAPICVKPIEWLIMITYPFVMSFDLFARFLTRNKKQEHITEEDILVALEVSAQGGAIESQEQDMVENIFRLGDRKVGVLMCPRIDIEWIDLDAPLEKIRDKILDSQHHRFPTCRGDMDEVVGIVHARDLLEKAWKNETIELENLSVSPLFVNETQKIFELLDVFKKQRETLALVTDEYGAIQGMITLGDVMHAIVRDTEELQTPIIKVSLNSWVVTGKCPVDEFKDFFHFDSLPDEERARYRTVSGFCMHLLGKIPKKGERFIVEAYTYEILQMDKKRVEKILVTRKT
ncbi:MAG: hypothetical protein S4CHLAM123_04860 [Chlamydiales bacterium]|nr:hypothetical protein [Chlamydiales bacterium]